jgi:hypothetical protein
VSGSTTEVVATAKNSDERLQFELVTCTLASNCYTHFPPRADPSSHSTQVGPDLQLARANLAGNWECCVSYWASERELSRRGKPPTSPEHGHSPANQSLALGNKSPSHAPTVHVYTAMLSPGLSCDLEPVHRIDATRIETIAQGEVSPTQEEAGSRVCRVGCSLVRRAQAREHQHEQHRSKPNQHQAYH